MSEFLQRLKQRKLVQWAVAYVAAAFALLQGIDIVAQQFGWPDGVRRGITLAMVVGFFVTLVLAWYHGERGAQRVSGTELLILALLLSLGGGFLWRFAGATRAPVAKAAVEPAAIPSAIPEKSIAVLPLVNASNDKDEQYFSDGLSEDLITALSQFAGLKVIGRNSSFQFRDSKDDSKTIGAKLGVAHLLEGSVRRAADAVRVSAELINAADGSTLWSQHYDRPYKDLFKLQDDITTAVADALKAKLLNASDAATQSDRPPSGDLAAYNAFLQGQFYSQRNTKSDYRKAIEFFQTATRLDPDYAAAYAAAADTWVDLAGYYLGDADMSFAYAQARIASNTAIRLNPDLAAAHLANSSVLVNADADWIGWQAEAQRALELAPRSALAHFQLSTAQAGLGHVKSAVELVRQALALNPLNGFWQSWLASYLASLGQIDEAEATAYKAVELLPHGAESHVTLTVVEILRGNAGAALAAAQHAPVGLNQDSATALALQIGPDRAEADAALNNLIAKHGDDSAYAYFIAELYALRRDAKNTFKWLDRAWVNHRGVDIQSLLWDPFILRYKDDPRFAAFCKKVGLPTTTEAKPMP